MRVKFSTGVNVPVDGRPGQGVEHRAVDGEPLPDLQIIMVGEEEEVRTPGQS